MVMKDSKDGALFSRRKILIWGSIVAGGLCALVILFVPAEPKNIGSTASLGRPPESMFKAEETAMTPQQNYSKYCAACHGDTGDANTQMARMMAVKPTNLVDGPYKFERTPEAIRNLIRSGSQVMPGFERELSETSAQALAEYVITFQIKKN